MVNSNMNRLEKKLLGVTRSRKPQQIVFIAFSVLFMTSILFIATTFPMGRNAVLGHLWIFGAFGVYLFLVFFAYFLLKSKLTKRKPCRRAWIYRASDTIMLLYASLILFAYALLAGENSIISSLIKANGKYILVALYICIAFVFAICAPSITRHNLQNLDNPTRLMEISFLLGMLGIVAGASFMVVRILIVTLSGQILLFLSFIGYILVSLFLIAIAMVFAYELIILASRGFLSSEHHQP
jgi:hypothetical protein